MPRKKTEETAEETVTQPTMENDTVETTDENAVEASANDGETKEEASASSSIAETVGATVGAFAANVADGISNIVSSVTGNSSTTDDEKSHHSKRAERIGIVQSDKMTKTVTVRVDRQIKHPIYRKYIKRRKNFMAHDELGAGIGDKVRIMETRPLSAKKRWRVVEILQKAEK